MDPGSASKQWTNNELKNKVQNLLASFIVASTNMVLALVFEAQQFNYFATPFLEGLQL